MNEGILQPVIVEDTKTKKQLQKAIEKRKQVIRRISTQIEMLKMELSLVEQEYNFRIGKLYLKDNQLDLEIIRCKNILHFMRLGLSYGEALKSIDDTFYADQKFYEKEYQKITNEEMMFTKRNTVSEDFLDEIKDLWKKILRKFHPDLVTDPKLKAQREEIVKQVNRAYAEDDYHTLEMIYQRKDLEDVTILAIDSLEEIVVSLENTIIHLQTQLRELKNSEWFVWKIRLDKAKKRNEDIFKHLEKNLLDDIVIKIDVLKKLKKEIGHEVI